MDPELEALVADLGGCGNDVEIENLDKLGHSIIIAGERFELRSGVPVVTWEDDPFWSFERVKGQFATLESPVCVPRILKSKDGGGGKVTTLEQLAETVKMVVLHSDGMKNSCGTFKVLANKGYSTHFMVDWNGVIYQALDPITKAIHAGEANDVSIGIDLNLVHANLLEDRDFSYPYGDIPGMADPKYKRPISEVMAINGSPKKAYGYTDAQYVSLIELLKVLTTNIGIPKQIPLNDQGDVVDRVLEDPAFQGIVAHWHLAESRWDPGPGFDWQRLYHALRGEFTHFPLQLEDGKDIPDLLEKSKVEAAAHEFFRNTEKGRGGYYPIGVNQNWHGGVHLHAPEGTPVRAIIDGKLVAARFGSTPELGSNNFVLLRHDIEMPANQTLKFFTLYMHLEPLDVHDPTVGIDWLKKAYRVYSGREKEDEEALDIDDKKDDHYYGKKDLPDAKIAPDEDEQAEAERKEEEKKAQKPFLGIGTGVAALRQGDVALFDLKEHPIEVRSGEVIGGVGFYSGSGERQTLVHLELFSDASYQQSIDMGVHGAQWVEVEEDVTPRLRVDNDDILSLFEGPVARRRHDSFFRQVGQRIPPGDIEDFFSIESESEEARTWLRKAITRHVSEWSDQVDWVKALSAAQDWNGKTEDFLRFLQDAQGNQRSGVFVNTIGQFLPFIWLNADVAKHIGLDLEDWNGVLYHFHPIHFLMWLTFHSSPRIKAISQGKSLRKLRDERKKRLEAELQERLAGRVTENSDMSHDFENEFYIEVEESSPTDVLNGYYTSSGQDEWKLPERKKE